MIDDATDGEEVSKAIESLAEGKTIAENGIHPEIIKSGGPKLIEAYTIMIWKAWEEI